MKTTFYITTAIDYTNDVIHIGHSYQKILADVFARYHRLQGNDTYFLTGTDEHGQKVQASAKQKHLPPKKYTDQIVTQNKAEWDSLNISYDRFIRTTDPDHKQFVQQFYLKVKAAGDIYQAKYKGLYCEGCEAYIDESELIKGKCPFHPTKTPSQISETNYFFRLSKYQNFLLDHLKTHPEFVWPESKKNEIISFIQQGLKDFSISRQKVSWGIPVPDDPQHTIYVWFDALINYLTYGTEENIWPANIHVLGKDNARFHAIYWPAMLKSAGYQLPQTILVHDFFSLNGQKISKSLGNVIRPSELVKKYGTDPIRYFFIRYGPLTSDVDMTLEKISEAYNADLANGLGNLIARVAKLCHTSGQKFTQNQPPEIFPEIHQFFRQYRFDHALGWLWEKKLKTLDKYIEHHRPWELKGKRLHNVLDKAVGDIRQIAHNLYPFLPQTAQKITTQFSSPIVKPTPSLFPRISQNP